MKAKAIVFENKTPIETLNKALAIPKTLHSEDGREFRIKTWDPHAHIGDIVTVSCELVVCLNDERNNESS